MLSARGANIAKPFDLFAQYARYGADQKVSLREVKTLEDFQRSVGESLQHALSDPTLVHGQRIEAMFESLVVSLGRYMLIKAEDAGRLHSTIDMIAPDFRIVLPDGAHWLVEVKNVHESNPARQRRRVFNSTYYKKLQAYAEATGAELKIAIYWSLWSIWTLVSPHRFIDEAGNLDIDLAAAMQANEMAQLGDRTVGARLPLRLRMIMDQEKTGPIQSDGTVKVTIRSTQVLCDGVEVTDEADRQTALILIQYGSWEGAEAQPVVQDDRLLSIDFEFAPAERHNEGFEMIGTLSRMFAQYYRDQTVSEGSVVQILAPQRPDWFAPLVRGNRKSSELPLWLFEQQPSYSDGKQ